MMSYVEDDGNHSFSRELLAAVILAADDTADGVK
jgi:hypothetical protein